MAYSQLYDAVQAIDGRISTRHLTELAIEFSDIKQIREMWSDVVVDEALRGFYIEGPLGPPVPVEENGALIALSRSMIKGTNGKHWRRLVYTKELMHVFDTEEEKASDEVKFDIQIQRFVDPTVGTSPQYRAEVKALWRALMALCQETRRQEFKASFDADEISLDMLAATLQIPLPYAHYLLQDNFDEIIANVKEG